MCENNMKNVTLDGGNNGCDGGCLFTKKTTVEEFIKKILHELEMNKALEEMEK